MSATYRNLVPQTIAGVACAVVLILGGVTAVGDHTMIRDQEERIRELAREVDDAELISAPAGADPERVAADSVMIEDFAADEAGSTAGESQVTLLTVRGRTYDYLVLTAVESSSADGRTTAAMLVSVDADGQVSEVSAATPTVVRRSSH